MIATIIVSVLGIISSVIAWKLNPRRVLYKDIDDTFREMEKLYVKRDRALATHDVDALTYVTDEFIKLRTRQNGLLQQVGSYSD